MNDRNGLYKQQYASSNSTRIKSMDKTTASSKTIGAQPVIGTKQSASKINVTQDHVNHGS
jgi:hypothetical protein